MSWRDDDHADKSRATFTIAPERLEAEMLRLEHSNRWALGILAPYAPLVVCYEDLFDATGYFAEPTIHTLAAHVGTDARSHVRRPLMLKQAPDDYLEGIENRAHLTRHFAGTRFAWMLGGSAG